LLHGWNGGADTTWQTFPRLICQDSTLVDTDLYVAHYPTYLERRQLSIAGLAGWLDQSFFSNTLRKYSHVDIIAHSMGGPIARSIYVINVLSGDNRIRSIITIASPSLGAQIAGIANTLGVSAALVADLAPGSVFLKSLEINWSKVPIKPTTYCFTSPQDQYVSMESAKYQCDCPYDYLQWDHAEMVKPMVAADERYWAPIRALQIIRGAQTDPSLRPRCFQ
jgi:hypothetical protein